MRIRLVGKRDGNDGEGRPVTPDVEIDGIRPDAGFVAVDVSGTNERHIREEYRSWRMGGASRGGHHPSPTEYTGRILMTPDEIAVLFHEMVAHSDKAPELKRVARAIAREFRAPSRSK